MKNQMSRRINSTHILHLVPAICLLGLLVLASLFTTARGHSGNKIVLAPYKTALYTGIDKDKLPVLRKCGEFISSASDNEILLIPSHLIASTRNFTGAALPFR